MKSRAIVAPLELVEANMQCSNYPFREVLPMPLKFSLHKFLSRRFFSLGMFAGALIAGLSACASLAAQQVDADHPQPAVQTSSTTTTDSAPQAAAATPQSSTTSAPAPQNQPAQSAQGEATGQQTKRILGIVPNFRAVSTDQKLPPVTIKDKFMGATEDSFDYSSIFFPAVIAGWNMDQRATPQFHQGAAGYARYFWHAAVDQTSENYMVEFIFPTLTHEDSRYYTLGRGGFVKRTGYALSRAVITRTNSGSETFNISEVFGAGAAAGVSNLYYPSASRTVGNTASEWALDVGIDAGVFWFREFWPDINRHIFHNKYSQ
ncbi:MAG: hypothetical protein ABSD59_10400 [Terracidiphilus sp.]